MVCQVLPCGRVPHGDGHSHSPTATRLSVSTLGRTIFGCKIVNKSQKIATLYKIFRETAEFGGKVNPRSFPIGEDNGDVSWL